jgi:hypothetical protein
LLFSPFILKKKDVSIASAIQIHINSSYRKSLNDALMVYFLRKWLTNLQETDTVHQLINIALFYLVNKDRQPKPTDESTAD